MKTEKDEAMRRERMRLIDADKLMQDIKDYHLSDGMFQHWVEVQPTIEDRPAFRWVPLTEALPETDKDVLVSLDNGEVLTGWRYDEEDGCWFLGTGDVNAGDDEIVAWAPLPEPWKEASR